MLLYIEILLWLFVMNIGIAFGAGLYEARIIVSEWVNSPSTYRWPDTGQKFWGFVTTVPLTILCIANLIAASLFHGVGSDWWLISSIIIAIERVFTFSYFIPKVLKVQQGTESISKPQLKRMATQWNHLNYIRLTITLIAWILALEAFSLII
jgi:hypothetical protein